MTPSNATVEAVFTASKPPTTHGPANLKALHVQALRRQLDDAVAAASTPEQHAAARRLRREVDGAENRFVKEFMPLVRKQVADARSGKAASAKGKAMLAIVPADVDSDEVMAAALVGLTVALRTWEPSLCCFTHVLFLKVWGEINRLVRDHKLIRGRSSYDDVHGNLTVDDCGGMVGGYQIIGGVPPTAGEDGPPNQKGKPKAPKQRRQAA